MSKRHLVVFFIGVLFATSNAFPADAERLVNTLRTGGHVLFIPHTQAQSESAVAYVTPPGCPPGTKLTRAGWQAALALGLGLLKQGVRVEEVYSSPVCAARHTAYLLFGADKVRLDASLNLDCAAKVGNAPEYARQLNRYLSTSPPHAEFNLALVGQICGLSALAEKEWPACAQNPGAGDVVVFQPHDTGFRVVGCLPFAAVNRWSLRKDLP